MNEYSGLGSVIPFPSFFSVIGSKSNYIYYKKRVVIKGQDWHGFGGIRCASTQKLEFLTLMRKKVCFKLFYNIFCYVKSDHYNIPPT